MTALEAPSPQASASLRFLFPSVPQRHRARAVKLIASTQQGLNGSATGLGGTGQTDLSRPATAAPVASSAVSAPTGYSCPARNANQRVAHDTKHATSVHVAFGRAAPFCEASCPAASGAQACTSCDADGAQSAGTSVAGVARPAPSTFAQWAHLLFPAELSRRQAAAQSKQPGRVQHKHPASPGSDVVAGGHASRAGSDQVSMLRHIAAVTLFVTVQRHACATHMCWSDRHQRLRARA